jgi:hypothetical protein
VLTVLAHAAHSLGLLAVHGVSALLPWRGRVRNDAPRPRSTDRSSRDSGLRGEDLIEQSLHVRCAQPLQMISDDRGKIAGYCSPFDRVSTRRRVASGSGMITLSIRIGCSA